MNVVRSAKDSRDYKISQYNLTKNIEGVSEYCLPLPDKKIALDQYNTPTCVGQACAMAKMISEYMLTNKWIGLSPYSIYGYYNNSGGGMSIRWGIEVLYKWGCLPLDKFSERGDNPELHKKLKKYLSNNPEVEKDIVPKYKIDSYVSVRDFDDIKTAIYNGMPVVGGLNVDSAFGKRNDGVEPRYISGKTEGHAVCFVGWKTIKDTEYLIAINSWGENGQDGRVYIPKGRSLYDTFGISDLHTPVKKKFKKVEFTIGSKTYKTEDGEFNFDAAPYIKNNRTFLPVRFVTEALGCSVTWDAVNSTAHIDSEEVSFSLQTGSRELVYSNKTNKIVKMDSKTEIVSNRMMCPIRYIAEALSCKVSWDGLQSKVTIQSL